MADQGMYEDQRSEDLPREGHGAGSILSSGTEISLLPRIFVNAVPMFPNCSIRTPVHDPRK